MKRRYFIKQSAFAGLAATSYPYIIRPTVAKYKTALIGSGWYAFGALGEGY